MSDLETKLDYAIEALAGALVLVFGLLSVWVLLIMLGGN